MNKNGNKKGSHSKQFIQEKIDESGKPPHLGPEEKKKEEWDIDNMDDEIIIETRNITSMSTNKGSLWERPAHIVAFQEHAMTPAEKTMMQKEAGDRGFCMKTVPIDPEHARKSGGVGTLTKKRASAGRHYPTHQGIQRCGGNRKIEDVRD